jgi:hypothetical protein
MYHTGHTSAGRRDVTLAHLVQCVGQVLRQPQRGSELPILQRCARLGTRDAGEARGKVLRSELAAHACHPQQLRVLPELLRHVVQVRLEAGLGWRAAGRAVTCRRKKRVGHASH